MSKAADLVRLFLANFLVNVHASIKMGSDWKKKKYCTDIVRNASQLCGVFLAGVARADVLTAT